MRRVRLLVASARLGVALATAVACATAPGCAPACDTGEGNAATRFEGGTTVNGLYRSSDWEGNWLHFPGGQRYDLVHHLGYAPALVDISLSFSESGVGSTTQNDTAAKAAGNSAEIELVNGEFIRIKNDTCAEFWVRVVATGDMREVGDGGVDGAQTGDSRSE